MFRLVLFQIVITCQFNTPFGVPKKLTHCLCDVYIHKIFLTFIIQSDLRITKMIPSHSGLFRPFN